MKPLNKARAVELLKLNGIEVSSDENILYPRREEFEDEVHDAIEYLIDECNFGFQYI
jgi:hypothetical protein